VAEVVEEWEDEEEEEETVKYFKSMVRLKRS